MEFTLRDLLWLVLVAALASSWLHSDRQRIAETQAVKDRYDEWLEQFRAETDETLKRYRQAAFDNPAFREWIDQRERGIAAYRDFQNERNRALAGETRSQRGRYLKVSPSFASCIRETITLGRSPAARQTTKLTDE